MEYVNSECTGGFRFLELEIFDKIKSLREAVKPIPDGAQVAIGGWVITRCLMAFVHEMVRQKKRSEAIDYVIESLKEEYEDEGRGIRDAMYDLERRLARHMILKEGRRIDGRSFNEVRPIECLVGVLPRVHGSALFTRGETQALVVTTLGTESDEQKIESIYGNHYRKFTFH